MYSRREDSIRKWSSALSRLAHCNRPF